MIKQPNISPIDGLVDLACRDGIDVRPTLLRVLTDLYVQKIVHSAEETTQYVELALGLIDTVDETTRATVAATLAGYPAAPAAVVEKLRGVQTAPQARLLLPEVAFGPTQPVADPLPAPVTRAVTHVPAAAPDSLTALFLDADPGERRLILANLDIVADPARSIAPATSEIVAQLEQAALKRKPAAFAVLLGRGLSVRRELAERISQDASGEPIVTAAKALGIRAAVLQRILLFLNPAIGQSVERVFDLAVLYDEISVAAAMHMVTLWRQDAPAPLQRRRHEPVYQDDARAVRRPVAREARPAGSRETAAPGKAAG